MKDGVGNFLLAGTPAARIAVIDAKHSRQAFGRPTDGL
jgi:hypothetical protein